MPTSAPVVVAIGDILRVTPVVWQSQILNLCLVGDGTIRTHLDGDSISQLGALPFVGTKDKVTALAIGDLLYVAWGSGGSVVMGVYDLALQVVTRPAVPVFDGRLPSMNLLKTDRLAINYVSPTNLHTVRVSTDLGVSWDSGTELHPNPVQDVDASISPFQNQVGVWEEVET